MKTDFSGVNFLVLTIFEEKFQIGRHLEFCFQGKKNSKKVNLQQRHYLKKYIFFFATICLKI
jgi:hypothetical protein